MEGGKSMQPLLSILVATQNCLQLQCITLNRYYGQACHAEKHYIQEKLRMNMELFMHC